MEVEKKEPKKRDLHDHLYLALTSLALIATGFAALFGGFQDFDTKKSLDIQKDVEVRQLRAYVAVDSISAEKPQKGADFIIELKIKNFGQTPAYEVKAINLVKVVPFDQIGASAPVDISKFIRNQTISLYPTQEIPSPQNVHQPFSEATLAAIADGRGVIVAHGAVIYKDVFGSLHKTPYCAYFKADQAAALSCPTEDEPS